MKKCIVSFCLLTLSILSLYADVSLKNLIEYDRSICLERLETATNEELWDVFLEGQAEYLFEPEFQWIGNEAWWRDVRNVLEIGSGNGAYLSKLADRFQEKTFLGIEKLPLSVQQANARYASEKVLFQEGDAEDFNESLSNSAEVILFRLVLQHLKQPLLALQHASHYLKSNGYILIIDSYDPARKTSHPIPTMDEAFERIAAAQRNNEVGNRKITFDILHMLEDPQSTLSGLYEVVFSNLDTTGKCLHENTRLEGEGARRRGFNHCLLLLTLFHRVYQIPIDMSKAYEELQEYLQDEEAWTTVGMHCLVLKKK